MRLLLSKCHIVGNHMSRLICFHSSHLSITGTQRLTAIIDVSLNVTDLTGVIPEFLERGF